MKPGPIVLAAAPAVAAFLVYAAIVFAVHPRSTDVVAWPDDARHAWERAPAIDPGFAIARPNLERLRRRSR